jgi:hypothetical protein
VLEAKKLTKKIAGLLPEALISAIFLYDRGANSKNHAQKIHSAFNFH